LLISTKVLFGCYPKTDSDLIALLPVSGQIPVWFKRRRCKQADWR